MTYEELRAQHGLTVAELIAHLQTLSQDAVVVVDGYEWGVGRIPIEAVTVTKARRMDKAEFQVVHITREGSPDVCDSGLGTDLEVEADW